MTGQSSVVMQVEDLAVQVAETGAMVLKGVSFELHAGEIFALVGESGSGKSVTSLAVMRLLPGALVITGGSVHVAGTDLFDLPEANMQTVRGQRVAMIFQNAMSALNPVQTAGEQVAETLRLPESQNGLGLFNALNLDGGSSTQVYSRTRQFRLTVPSFIAVPTGLGVF